jgi:hypothetical protein
MAKSILPYKNLGDAIGMSVDLKGIPYTALGEHSILVDASQAGQSLTVEIEAQLPSGHCPVVPETRAK